MKPNQLVTTLRRIASNIERSKNPDRNLVARDLKKVVVAINNSTDSGTPLTQEHYPVSMTTYGDMNDPSTYKPTHYTLSNIARRLGRDPNAAVVFINDGVQVAFWQGADETGSAWYYQYLPLEDPNDATQAASSDVLSALNECVSNM